MYAAPTRCPVCSSELEITRLHRSACDTSIEGRFAGGLIAHIAWNKKWDFPTQRFETVCMK